MIKHDNMTASPMRKVLILLLPLALLVTACSGAATSPHHLPPATKTTPHSALSPSSMPSIPHLNQKYYALAAAPKGCSNKASLLTTEYFWQEAISYENGNHNANIPAWLRSYFISMVPKGKPVPTPNDKILTFQQVKSVLHSTKAQTSFNLLIKLALKNSTTPQQTSTEDVAGTLNFTCQTNTWLATSWNLNGDPF